jgi:hypothetical protein
LIEFGRFRYALLTNRVFCTVFNPYSLLMLMDQYLLLSETPKSSYNMNDLKIDYTLHGYRLRFLTQVIVLIITSNLITKAQFLTVQIII